MESTPSVAVPVSVMTHDVRPGPVALPFAFKLIAVGEVNVPSAAPVNFRSPAQLALNEPLAVVVVCSVTFHLKSVQVFGDGIRLDEVQLPSSELLPASLGPVVELRRSKACTAHRDGSRQGNRDDLDSILHCLFIRVCIFGNRWRSHARFLRVDYRPH